MTYDRFCDLKSIVRYNVTWLVGYINAKFKLAWRVGHIVTVDETIFPFKGRCFFKQHIRGKPDATGLKVYLLCDESCYCFSFWIYWTETKKERSSRVNDIVLDFISEVFDPAAMVPPSEEDIPCEEESGESESEGGFDLDEGEDEQSVQTVRHIADIDEEDLNDDSDEDPTYTEDPSDDERNAEVEKKDMADYHQVFQKENPPPPPVEPERGVGLAKLWKLKTESCIPLHTKMVVMDNYYGSFDLVRILDDLGLYAVACVRMNRDVDLKESMAQGLPKGDVRNLYHKERPISYCIWHDSKVISFCSNFSSGYYSVEKTLKKGVRRQYPVVAKIYNQYMNFVDQFDALLKCQWNRHRKVKWTHSLLYGLLKMCSVNAFILHASVTVLPKRTRTFSTGFGRLLQRSNWEEGPRRGARPCA